MRAREFILDESKILHEQDGGDCFEAAGRAMISPKLPGLKLVHAYVSGQGTLKGKRFPHAWNEIGDVVLDNSNKRNIVMRKEQYYKIGNVRQEPGEYAVYDDVEAKKKMLQTKHWGPWDLDPDKEQLEEGWREKLAGTMAAATLAYGGYHNLQKEPPHTKPAHQQEKKLKSFQLNFADVNPLRDILVQKARSVGFKDFEIAHLISQVATETGNFAHLEEKGSPKYFKKYERGIIKNKKTGKNTPNYLGNMYPGDGVRFKGRGFIQLTGRENYRRAGEALGIPLEQHPELALVPKHAVDIAIWYWTKRTKTKVKDFDNATVQQVTKTINPGLKGLQDREAHFTRLTQR